VFQTDS